MLCSYGKSTEGFCHGQQRFCYPTAFTQCGYPVWCGWGWGLQSFVFCARKNFRTYGLTRKNAFKAIIGTVICFIPSICCIFLSGQFSGYQPFSILITDDVIASGIPLFSHRHGFDCCLCGDFLRDLTMLVVCEKIDRRYPSKKKWLDYGAITCAVICILFHPFSTSFWGIVEIITTFICNIWDADGKKANWQRQWGCVFAFCFIWNAI